MINDEVKMNHKNNRKNKKEVLDEQKIIDKQEIGKRFKTFRTDINKAQHELGSELDVGQAVISRIERGECYPHFRHLNHLYKKYRLNIRWLVSGKGEMFIRNEGPILVPDQKYCELFNLMKVPFIELQILAKLTETKIILKDNIKNYMKNEKNKHAI